MSYTQFPVNDNTGNTSSFNEKPKKDNRNLIYGLLSGALIISWGYFIYDKNKAKEEKIQYIERIVQDSLSKEALQLQFDLLTSKADSITANNQQLQGAITERSNEIQKLRNSIAVILKNKNATAAELAEAKKQIVELQGKIEALYAEVETLKAENKQLTASNEQLNEDKKKLNEEKTELQGNLDKTKAEKARVEDLASTLHVSGINITAVSVKGTKEKETSKAKKADFFKVSFVVDENRVAPNGTKDLMVAVYYPDGRLSQSSGSFTDRQGNTKQYTQKVEIEFEQGKKIPASFNWKPGDKLEPGDYKVEIYSNGFKIGEGVKKLDKSSFLGL